MSDESVSAMQYPNMMIWQFTYYTVACWQHASEVELYLPKNIFKSHSYNLAHFSSLHFFFSLLQDCSILGKPRQLLKKWWPIWREHTVGESQWKPLSSRACRKENGLQTDLRNSRKRRFRQRKGDSWLN